MKSYTDPIDDDQLRAGYYSVSFLWQRLVIVLLHKIKIKLFPARLQQKKIDFALYAFTILQKFFPHDTYILYDNCYENNVELIDAYSLFIFLREHGHRAYYLLWADNPFYQELKIQGRLENVIVMSENIHRDHEYSYFYRLFWIALRAKVIIASFGGLSEKIVRFFVQNRYIKYVFINHGPSLLKKLNPAICKVQTPALANHFLVSSAAESEFASQYLGWKQNQLLRAGMPRWDLLRKRRHQHINILLFFTWRYSFQQLNSVQISDLEYFSKINNLLNNKRLRKIAHEHDVHFYFVRHHFQETLLGGGVNGLTFDESDNIHFVDTTKVSEAICKCDLCISDFSSIVFDCLFLQIPVLFYIPDFQDASVCLDDKQAFAFAHDQINKYLFNYCASESELITRIKYYLDHNCQLEEKYKQIVRQHYYVRTQARQRIIDEIG